MATYKINKSEITGKKGISFYKNQIIDEKHFVGGSIDHLVSIGAIEAAEVEKTDEKAEKTAKKPVKPAE
jgi:hypothetical protein